MHAMRLVLSVVVAFTMIGAAPAWTADRPANQANDLAPLACPRPQTKIAFSNGRTYTFGEGDGANCHYTDDKGQAETRWAVFWRSSTPQAQQFASSVTELWPLVVGREKALVYSTGDTNWHYTYKVARRETVTVRAGSFDTFLVEWEQTGSGRNSHHSVQRYWYAPDVGFFVKYDFELIRGTFTNNNRPTPYEAVRVSRPNT